MRLQRSSDRIVKISGARAGRPLDRAAIGAPIPREATVPRERSLNNFWRDKALHDMKINFWSEKALHDTKIAGDFV